MKETFKMWVDPVQHAWAKREARRLKCSVAQVYRYAVERLMIETEGKGKR